MRLRLRAHGVVSERFHSELFQEAQGLLTKFNENQHEPRLWAKTKHFMRWKIFIVENNLNLTFIKTLGNDLVFTQSY